MSCFTGKMGLYRSTRLQGKRFRDYRRCVVRASGCRGETVIARTSGQDVWTDSVEVPTHKACNPGKYSGNGARPRAYPGPYTLLYFNINKN